MSVEKLDYDSLSEGMDLPEINRGPVDRKQLIDYASASGDYNKIHHDNEFAKKSGLEGTIVHGMLSMALVGTYITNIVKGGKLKNFNIRFMGMTKENDMLIMKGKVVKKYEEDGQKLLEISMVSETQDNRVTTSGSAVIVF